MSSRESARATGLGRVLHSAGRLDAVQPEALAQNGEQGEGGRTKSVRDWSTKGERMYGDRLRVLRRTALGFRARKAERQTPTDGGCAAMESLTVSSILHNPCRICQRHSGEEIQTKQLLEYRPKWYFESSTQNGTESGPKTRRRRGQVL